MSTTATTTRPRSLNGLFALVGLLAVGGGAFFLGRNTGGRSDTPPQAAQETGHDEAGNGEPGHEEGGAGHNGHGEEGVVKFDAGALKLAALRVEPMRETALPSRLTVTGAVEPNLSGVARVTSRVAGKVTALRANVGDAVRAGQPLATVASAELATAQAAYRQAGARASVAQTNLLRQRRLAGLGEFGRHKVEEARARSTETQGVVQVAEREVAEAKAEVTEAESGRAALEAAVAQAQNRLELSRTRLQRAEALFREELLSRQDLEQARADERNAASDVTAARANAAKGVAEVESAQARLRAAQSRLETGRGSDRIAREQLAREEKVFKGGYYTSQEIVTAEAALRQAQQEQRAAAENVRLLGGTPGGGNTVTVAAPLSGRVTERGVTLGETVTPEKALFSLLNSQSVWVQLNVYQKDLAGVRVGQAVAVTSDAAPGATFRGEVSSVGATLDEETRTVKVRAVIGNAGGRLRPGVFVSGGIVGAGADGGRGIAVPQDAVQELEGKQVVFVAGDHEGEFKAQPVEVGGTVGDRVEIRSGLKPGDRIVTKNAFTVKAQAMKAELGEGHAH